MRGRRIFEWNASDPLTLDKMLSRVHPEDLADVRKSLERAANDAPDFDFEHRLLLPGGEVKTRAGGRPSTGEFRRRRAHRRRHGCYQRSERRSRPCGLREPNSLTSCAVTSLGELTASIAHEVNQPLGAVVANAEACIGWLDRDRPDLGEARAAIARIVSDGLRAGEVIRRVRALVKRAEMEVTRLDINEVVIEALAFLRHEFERSQVSVQLELGTDPIPPCSSIESSFNRCSST